MYRKRCFRGCETVWWGVEGNFRPWGRGVWELSGKIGPDSVMVCPVLLSKTYTTVPYLQSVVRGSNPGQCSVLERAVY